MSWASSAISERRVSITAFVTPSAASCGISPVSAAIPCDELLHGSRLRSAVYAAWRGEQGPHIGGEMGGDMVAFISREPISEGGQNASHHRPGCALVDASRDGGVTQGAKCLRRWMYGTAFRRPAVAPDEADMQIRLHARHTCHRGDRPFQLGGLLVSVHFPVEQGDVVLHHHVNVGQVEPLLETAQRRANPIGQYVVDDVGIGMTAAHSVTHTLQTAAEIANPTTRAVELMTHEPVGSRPRAQHGHAGRHRQPTYREPRSCTHTDVLL